MKKVISTSFFSNLLIILLFFSISCGDSGNDSPLGPVPEITRFEPAVGQAGVQIQIIGHNLGKASTSEVYFTGSNSAQVSAAINGTGHSSEEEWLWVNVPEGATTGPVTVINNDVPGKSSSSFEVLVPEESLSAHPGAGALGTSVILTGIDFTGDKSDYSVTFKTQSGRFTGYVARVEPEGGFVLVYPPNFSVTGKIHLEHDGKIYATTEDYEILECNVTTFAGGADGHIDGTGTSARFNNPSGMVAVGTEIYIVDTNNDMIRAIDTETGEVTTLTEGGYGYVDGTLAEAKFNSPYDITMGADGHLYVADGWNHCIRQINLSTNMVTTVAGTGTTGQQDGIGTDAVLRIPYGITTGSDGMIYFTEESDSHRVKRFNPDTQEVTTIAGTGNAGYNDGAGATAEFSHATDLVEVDGVLYITDSGNGLIRTLNLSDFTVGTLVGGGSYDYSSADGVGEYCSFNDPAGIDFDGESLIVADVNLVRRIDIATGSVTRVAGVNTISFEPVNGICSDAEFENLIGITVTSSGDIFVADATGFSVEKSLIRRIQ